MAYRITSLISLVGILLFACVGKNDENMSDDLLNVRVSQVRLVEAPHIIRTTAVLEAIRSVSLSFLQWGYLESASYDLGDFVNKGDTLASLDLRPLQAEYKRAVASLAKARRDFERLKSLNSTETVSQSKLDDAETVLGMAEAAFESAEFALEHGQIIAPFSGYIAGKFYQPEQNIAPGQPVYNLIDRDSLKIIAGIASEKVRFLQVGDKVKITPSAANDASVIGKVTGLPAAGNLYQGTMPLKIELRNPGDWLPGMSVEIEIITTSKATKIVIPAQAVCITSEGEAYCYKYRPKMGDVVKIPLEVGLPVLDSGLEVLAGINPGEFVVIEGIEKVRDGDKVNVLPIGKYKGEGID